MTFTATVSSADDGTSATPTGTVTFEDGSTVLGTASLTPDSSGAEASLTVSNLGASGSGIVAIYSGDAVFSVGASESLDGTVGQDISSTSLSASATDPTSGETVTFTATVSGTYTDGTPTGTVTFLDGTTVLGTTTLSAAISGAQATFTTASLAIGWHTITAEYNGDADFAASTSASVSASVSQDSTSASLSTSAASADAGQSVTFTATITSASGGTPTGMVTFLDGSTVLGSASLSAATAGAQATFTTSALASGSHSITTIYGGNSGFGGSSISLSQVVGSSTATQSSILLSSSETWSAPGQAVTLTAEVSGDDGGTPTGSVTFLDGTTVLGTASLSASFGQAQATLTTSSLTAATHSITAIYGGDSTYAASTSASLVQSVQQAGTSVAVSSSAYPSNPGQSITLTAAVSGDDGGAPTGTVTFLDGSTILGTGSLSADSSGAQATFTTSSLALGNHSLIALYSGDSNYANSSSASLSQPVQLVDSSTSVTCSADSSALGQAATFTATVSGDNGGTPTGTVVFLDGITALGDAILSATSSGAQASFTTSALALGTHNITALYCGDSAFAGSTSDVTTQSVQQVLSWTILSSSATLAMPGQPLTFTATVLGANGGTPTGTVTFEDGANVLGTVSLAAASSGAQAAFTTSSLANGMHSIVAVYSGDTTFVASSASLGQRVGQASATSTSTTLSSSASTAAPGQSVTFTATVTATGNGTPTGTVTFKDGSTVLGAATLSPASSGSQASFTIANLAAGSHSITAVYGGDHTYAGGSSSGLSETISQLSSSVSLSSSAAPAAPGQLVTFTATVSGSDGGTPTGTVTFKDGSTTLGSAAVLATASGEQAIFTISTLANGTHSITAAYSGDSATPRRPRVR